MIHISADRLRLVVREVFEGAGVPRAIAELIAHSLVESNLMGHDSHGVLRISYYIRDVIEGRTNPHAQATVVRESATAALLDGGGAFGQVGLCQAMERAMDKAQHHDIGVVAIYNTHHTGRMGEYVVQAAEGGFIGMVFCRGPVRDGLVAPYQGVGRALNTNPIAWGVPAAKHPPVFFDFATSLAAQGKIEAAIDKGVSIPEGWLLDAQGNPTTDPHEQRRGGALLPFGGHKGYGLAVLIELVAGGLTGTSCGLLPDFASGYATVALALNIAAFQPLAQFCVMVDEFIEAIKATPRAPGAEEILVPGEIEWRTRALHLRDGLNLPDATWGRIVEAGARCGVEVTLDEGTSEPVSASAPCGQ